MAGARRDQYEAALKEAGIKRQAVWHQQTPDGGTLAIVYVEATDPDASPALCLVRRGDQSVVRAADAGSART